MPTATSSVTISGALKVAKRTSTRTCWEFCRATTRTAAIRMPTTQARQLTCLLSSAPMRLNLARRPGGGDQRDRQAQARRTAQGSDAPAGLDCLADLADAIAPKSGDRRVEIGRDERHSPEE